MNNKIYIAAHLFRAAEHARRFALELETIADKLDEEGREEVNPGAAERALAANLARSLDDLELSVRTMNCLHNAGHKTIGDVTSMTRAEVIATKNLGRKSFNELAEVLQTLGVSFKEE